jgi:hypothetical protein
MVMVGFYSKMIYLNDDYLMLLIFLREYFAFCKNRLKSHYCN